MRAVVAARRLGGGQAYEGLALEVVLEDVLLVARERAVGQAQDVVALDQLAEQLAQEHDVLAASPPSHTSGGASP